MTKFTLFNAFIAALIGIAFILIMSLVKEPTKRRLNVLMIAGGGAVYWNGGLGIYELIFGLVMFIVAMQGFKHYYFIGIGWLLHTVWDILHHLNHHPLLPFDPISSAGCAVCDPIMAIWFLFGAPNVFKLFKKIKPTTAYPADPS